MRAVIQRVSSGQVDVAGVTVGSIGKGLVVLLGVGPDDSESDATALAAKLVDLRIFRDEHGKMNKSIGDVGGSVLVVSQFTLYGDVRRGRRPGFSAAAPPELAEPLVAATVSAIRSLGVETAEGRFGADMALTITNDGPVTLIVEVVDGRVI